VADPPSGWETDVLLSDGLAAHVRPIAADDAAALVSFHGRLSAETIYRRFFSPHPRLSDREVRRFTQVDYGDRMAFVATGAAEDLMAVARYDRTPGAPTAEAAFVVADQHQGKGLGTILLEYLAVYARTQGISRFFAETLMENRAMRGVFRRAGFRETTSFDSGVVHIELDLSPSAEARAAMEERDRVAVVRSVERFLRPQSIAVIGASRSAGRVGYEITRRLLEAGFPGRILPINEKGGEVCGQPAWTSLDQVPEDVDLAVLCVPAPRLKQAVEDCGRRGVGGLVVVTSGFSLESKSNRELVRWARSWGMRLLGPSSAGVINTESSVSLQAALTLHPPRPGGAGLCTQSAGIGVALLEDLWSRGIGLSGFVSTGDKADVSGNDVIRYWEQDARTEVGLLYLESLGNPRAFRRVAGHAARFKPLVALKVGRSRAGGEPPGSVPEDEALDAVCRAAGVIRVDGVGQLLDSAAYFLCHPPPAGDGLAVVGNSTGGAAIALDACEAAGLSLVGSGRAGPLRAEQPGLSTAKGATAVLGPEAGLDEFRRAVLAGAAQPDADAVLVVMAPTPVVTYSQLEEALGELASRLGKPLVACLLGAPESGSTIGTAGGRVPLYRYPEDAVGALARARWYGEWLERGQAVLIPEDRLDEEAASRVVAESLSRSGEGWMEQDLLDELLAGHGLLDPSPPGGAPPDGPLLRAGVWQLPELGPCVGLGFGGSLGALVGEMSYASAPVGEWEADRMVSGLRDRLSRGGWPWTGAGADPLLAVLARLGRLALAHPEVVELWLEPVSLDGAVVASRARSEYPVAPQNLELRRLRQEPG
jgi:acyl-CoA synthetase (NDP forming)/GNAT superfamily N-acetyltransferase